MNNDQSNVNDTAIIKDILLKGSYVTPEDIRRAEEYATKNKSSFEGYLLNEGIITKNLLGQAIAEFFKLDYADLQVDAPSPQQVQAIPEDIARTYRIVLYKWDALNLTIATDNPNKQELLVFLSTLYPDKKIHLAYSFPEDIDNSFICYRKPLETRFSEILKNKSVIAPEIIKEIVSDAVAFKASDIHFEPQENELEVRFRIDGVLREAGRIPKDIYENILNRIKVQAHIRTDEHFSAQDGAIRFLTTEGTVDMRVSIIPTLDGEKVVIRLLAEYVKGFTFADLGISGKDQEIFLNSAKKPFGMILVTGPTGSGKTTTLYALLKMLNQPGINITTIEDPVEYKIQGVNSIQVNPQTNLTFAKGLRSIIRQDPDIILVGEIRDLETAEIAVNAALTGQLLFSTFHANDAATAIPRLLDMGVEPFLMASTLELVIAQRLVRKICDRCKTSNSVSLSDLEKVHPHVRKYYTQNPATLYKGKGCVYCSNSGYKGRTAIFEFIQISQEMQDLILRKPSARQISELAFKEGGRSLFEDGIEKVKSGITTIDELLRVTPPPKKNVS